METLAHAALATRRAAAAEQLDDLIVLTRLIQEQTLAMRAALGWNAEAAIRAELDSASLQFEEAMLALERAIEATRPARRPEPVAVIA